MENPNEYNNEDFTRYSNELINAIGGMLGSGASLDDIADAIETSIENVPTEPSPEAREAAREWVQMNVVEMLDPDNGLYLSQGYFHQPPDVQAAIRDELGGGAP